MILESATTAFANEFVTIGAVMLELLEGLHAEGEQTASTPAAGEKYESTCCPSTLSCLGLHPGDDRLLAGGTDRGNGLVVVEVDHADGDGVTFLVTTDAPGPCAGITLSSHSHFEDKVY